MDKKNIMIGFLILMILMLSLLVSSELKKSDPVSITSYRIFELGVEKEVLEYYYFNTTCIYYPSNGTYAPCKHIINITTTLMEYDENQKKLRYGAVESVMTLETAK